MGQREVLAVHDFSVLSCYLLKKIKAWPIQSFKPFNTINELPVINYLCYAQRILESSGGASTASQWKEVFKILFNVDFTKSRTQATEFVGRF